jgi:hypothetical protein
LSLKVADHGPGILANVSKVHSLATMLKDEKAIEGLEQNRTRLMDGAKNSLPSIRQFPEKGVNRPGSLTVETRGRLIQEQ